MVPKESKEHEESSSSTENVNADSDDTKLKSIQSGKNRKTVRWGANVVKNYIVHDDNCHISVPETPGESDSTELSEETSSDALPASTTRNDRKCQFLQRLMNLLSEDSLSSVVTWLPHGRSFVILRPDLFSDAVLPNFISNDDEKQQSISTSNKLAANNTANVNARRYRSFLRKLTGW